MVAFSVSSAQAQVPTSVDPSQVEKRFDTKPTVSTSNINGAPLIGTPALPSKAQKALANKRFTLRKVVIKGATAYTPDQLRFIYKDSLGERISMLDADGMARRITELYRDDLYVLSRTTVAGEENGTLTLHVTEGYITSVQLAGDPIKGDGAQKTLDGYGKKLTSQRPVRLPDLERYLLLIGDLPGTTAKGFLRPSATQNGATDFVVTVTNTPFEAGYSIDNRGSKYIGPIQHTASVAANSLLGLYDRTQLRFITTSPTTELRFIDLQHEQPIGHNGAKVALSASHSHTEPGDSLKSTKIVGRSTFLQAKAAYPLIRTRQENLNGRILFDTRDTDTNVSTNTNLSDDRLRAVRIGGSYDFADRFRGATLLDMQVSQGVNVFNATHSADASTRTGADGTFTKFNADISRTHPLPKNFSLFTSASGQYALDRLLAAEQFTLGGASFGSAYDPSELSGDYGAAGKAELRYSRYVGRQYLQAYQLYGFYDIGRVWLRAASPGDNDKKSLSSAGIGARTNFTSSVWGYVEAAKPLTKPVANQGGHGTDPRVFFSVSKRF